METNRRECTGTLKISDDVIISIASNVIRETDGVCVHKKKNPLKFCADPSIEVKFGEGDAEICVLVDMEYGVNTYSCAEHIQKKIKSCVMDMTKIVVSKVNVKIVDLV